MSSGLIEASAASTESLSADKSIGSSLSLLVSGGTALLAETATPPAGVGGGADGEGAAAVCCSSVFDAMVNVVRNQVSLAVNMFLQTRTSHSGSRVFHR